MNALVQIANSNVEAYRASTEAASLCRKIVVATASTIQGRKYVAVEGWQAIARAHGCAVGATGVERVEGGVRAIGEVRDMLTGTVIATGEGFVGEDEPTWYGGPGKFGKILPKRADYAIRAMAQTRAMSRACRSAFAHVVVMMNAGLATTPAEEMAGVEQHDPETGEIIETADKIPGIHKIKEQLGKLRTAGDAAKTLEDFNALVKAEADNLTKIKDAKHEWWTGDGADFVGYRDWIVRRRCELAEPSALDALIDQLRDCETKAAMDTLLIENEAFIGDLDGADVRRWEAAYNLREEGVKLMAGVN